jgi:quercetin dioxygenase-like cupin family protein
MADVITDPVRRQRISFRTEGNVLHAEVRVDPGGDVPKHFHPSQEERFEVGAGTVQFTVDGKKVEAAAGDRLVAPPGTLHSFRNTGDTEAVLLVEVEPALRMQAFLEEAARLAREGKYTRRGIPRGPGAAMEMAVFTDDYRDTTIVTSPPRIVQRLFLAPLATLGRRRGYGKSR